MTISDDKTIMFLEKLDELHALISPTTNLIYTPVSHYFLERKKKLVDCN